MVLLGLPGSVGSIFVSRLSTALHAAALLPSSNMSGSRGEDPNPNLVMITLLLVTIPVEVIFLATLHWLGWLRLPILFAVFSVIFFCCAVSASTLSSMSNLISCFFAGHYITLSGTISSQLPLVEESRSRHIRTPNPLRLHGPRRPTPPGPLF
jgi:cation transporter-like permease